jgi:hypothetical protein
MESAAPKKHRRRRRHRHRHRRRGETEDRPSLWRRVPIPLLVTLIGIVLSAWLLPAFTRQWDDRQKAGEVRASVIYEAASATARALTDAQDAAFAETWKGSTRPTSPPSAKEWAVASLRIQARLQAYFEPDALERWLLVSRYVTSTLSLTHGDAGVPFTEPFTRRRSTRLEHELLEYWDHRLDCSHLVAAILAEEQNLTRRILGMHVRGYSTTWRDAVSDLFPFV